MPRKSGWLPIEAASAVAQQRGIRTIAAWRAFATSPEGRALPVPVNAHRIYADQWLGWEAFLDVETRLSKRGARDLRAFADARSFARTLGLTNPQQWQFFAASLLCPADLPAQPERSYAGQGWNGYPDFLGYQPHSGPKEFLPFSRARAIARSLGFSGSPQYKEWALSDQRRDGMPTHPDRTYKAAWKGWSDFLGASHGSTPSGPQRECLPFEFARYAAQGLGFQHPDEYRAWAARNGSAVGMPVRADNAYRKEGWTGWPDFLGAEPAGRAKSRTLLSFAEARKLTRAAKLASAEDYRKTLVPAHPGKLPLRPEATYANRGWAGWADFGGFKVAQRGKSRKQTRKG